MRKETVYTVPYETKEEQKAAHEFKSELHQQYEVVSLYATPYDARIVCEGELSQCDHVIRDADCRWCN